MAKRPVFIVNLQPPHFAAVETEFRYYSGFSDSQVQKSVRSLHEAYSQLCPQAKILEISSKSEEALGQRLSAFNLRMHVNGEMYPVENVFQSSKVFENGGPFTELLNATPSAAKKDSRLRESGNLIAFEWQGKRFPLEPLTFFYDWIYIKALADNPEIAEALIGYDAFTDIVFNPQKSFNCQARSAAIYVSLFRSKELEKATASSEKFKEIVYQVTREPSTFVQESLFG